MKNPRAPILLLQWSPVGELDELAIVEERYEELAAEHFAKGEVPSISTGRFTIGNTDDFSQHVRSALSAWANPQTLYFSSHGNLRHLSFDSASSATLSFEALGEILRDCLQEDAYLTLVLGSCKGLHPDSALLSHLPNSVREVYGFTGKPRPQDVAHLLVGVLIDQSRIYNEYRAANKAAFGSGVSGDAAISTAIQALNAMWDKIDDAFQENPTKFVSSPQGTSVRVMKRVEYDEGGSSWQGYEIRLK